MKKGPTNFIDTLHTIKEMIPFFGVSRRYFLFYLFVVVLMSILIAVFEGLSLSLLVPIMRMIVRRRVFFLSKNWLFRPLTDHYPGFFEVVPAIIIFTILISIFFLFVLLKNVFSYFFNIYVAYHRERFKFNLKGCLFKRYLEFGKLFFDRTSKSDLIVTLRYSNHLVKLVSILNSMLKALALFTVYLVMMLMISWPLTLFFIAVFPFLFSIVNHLLVGIEKASKYETEMTVRETRELFNIISYVPLIKVYNAEQKAMDKFNSAASRVMHLGMSVDKKKAVMKPFQEILMIVFLIILTIAVAFVVIPNRQGGLFSYLLFLILGRRMMPLFTSFNSARAFYAQKVPKIGKFREVFSDDHKFIIPEGPAECTTLQKGLEFRNVQFSYIPEVPVLKNLSFSIEKGKMTAIVGPTGSGKTTTISLITRFYDCSPASIFWDGEDIRNFNLNSIHEHIAFVSQDVLLFNDSIKNNLNYGLKRSVSEDELIQVVQKTRLHNFIAKLPNGFETEIGDYGVKLSGGEKQRLAIARAILKGVDVLILDEATSSLDTKTERLIQEALEESIVGRTVIVVAHRLSTIKHADKIIVIENGRSAEEGTLDELLVKRGLFFQYWEEQRFI